MLPGSRSERKRIFAVTGLATLMNTGIAHITVGKFSTAKESSMLTRPLSRHPWSARVIVLLSLSVGLLSRGTFSEPSAVRTLRKWLLKK